MEEKKIPPCVYKSAPMALPRLNLRRADEYVNVMIGEILL